MFCLVAVFAAYRQDAANSFVLLFAVNTGIFLISLKAHDIGNSARYGKGGAELLFLRHVIKTWQTILPYCRKNGTIAFFFQQFEDVSFTYATRQSLAKVVQR